MRFPEIFDDLVISARLGAVEKWDNLLDIRWRFFFIQPPPLHDHAGAITGKGS